MKLWLDDIRPAPGGWHWVKNSAEAIVFYSCYAPYITEMSLDHDLGEDDTSIKFLNVLEVMDQQGTLPMFSWGIHSQNPVGRENMQRIMQRFWRKR